MKRLICLLFAVMIFMSTISFALASKEDDIYSACNVGKYWYYTCDEKIWIRSMLEDDATILVDLANYAEQMGDNRWRHAMLVRNNARLYLLYPHGGILYEVLPWGTLKEIVKLDISGLSKHWGENPHYTIVNELMIVNDVLYMAMIIPGDDIYTTNYGDIHMYAFSLETGQRVMLDVRF